jgi:hypothetical protein
MLLHSLGVAATMSPSVRSGLHGLYRCTQPSGLLLHAMQRLHHLPRPVQFPPRRRPVAVCDALQQRQGRRGVLLHQLQLVLRGCHRQPHVLWRHLGDGEADRAGAFHPDVEAFLRIGHAGACRPTSW